MKKNKLFIIIITLIFITIFSLSAILNQCGTASTEIKNIEDSDNYIEEETEISEIIQISAEEVYVIIIEEKDFLILDVRTIEEYNSGHIETAIHIPVTEIGDRLNELPKDRPIIVYCNGSSCARSGRAATILLENGFKEIYDLVGGGITEWGKKGYPILKE